MPSLPDISPRNPRPSPRGGESTPSIPARRPAAGVHGAGSRGGVRLSSGGEQPAAASPRAGGEPPRSSDEDLDSALARIQEMLQEERAALLELESDAESEADSNAARSGIRGGLQPEHLAKQHVSGSDKSETSPGRNSMASGSEAAEPSATPPARVRLGTAGPAGSVVTSNALVPTLPLPQLPLSDLPSTSVTPRRDIAAQHEKLSPCITPRDTLPPHTPQPLAGPGFQLSTATPSAQHKQLSLLSRESHAQQKPARSVNVCELIGAYFEKRGVAMRAEAARLLQAAAFDAWLVLTLRCRRQEEHRERIQVARSCEI
jgi:hypothetical protein